MALERVGVQAVIDGLQPYLTGIKQMDTATANLGTSLGTKLKVASAAAAVGFAAVGTAAVGFGLKGLHTADQMEQMKLGFETLLGSASKAQQRLDDLAKFAAETPFELAGISKAARLLETFGNYSMQTLTMVGDAAAGVSAPIEEIAFWVGRAYSAIQSGRPFGEAAMRLQEMGLLSGVARNKMEELQKSGASADVVYGALSTELGRFSGLMIKQSQTIGGLQSTLSDNFNLMLAALMTPFVAKYKAGLGFVIEQIDAHQKDIVGFGMQVANGMDLVFGAFSKGLSVIAPFAASLPVVVAGLIALGAAIVAIQIAAFISEVVSMTAGFGVMNVAVATSTGLLASLRAVLATTQGQIAVFVIALVAIDQVVKRLTGSGLLSWFRGTQNNAKNAAAMLTYYGTQQDEVNRLVAEGMPADKARTVTLMDYVNKLKQATLIQANAIAQGKPAFAATEAQTMAYKYLAEQLLALNPTYHELLAVQEKVPEISPYITAALDAQKKAWDTLQLEAEVENIKNIAKNLSDARKPAEDFGVLVQRMATQTMDLNAAFEAIAETVSGATDEIKSYEDAVAALVAPATQEEANLRAVSAGYDAQIKAREAWVASGGELTAQQQQEQDGWQKAKDAADAQLDSITANKDAQVSYIDALLVGRPTLAGQADLINQAGNAVLAHNAALTQATQIVLTEASAARGASADTLAYAMSFDRAADAGRNFAGVMAGLIAQGFNPYNPFLPGYQYGGIVPGPVGMPQLSIVHGGERIMPPAGSPSNSLALSVPLTLNMPQNASWSMMIRAAHTALDSALDSARTQSFKSGAALSSGIG